MVAAAEFNDTNGEILVNSMYSKSALHGVPLSINLATNAIVKALFNESFSISISNTPAKTTLYRIFTFRVVSDQCYKHLVHSDASK
jgi:hypothetical protein